MTKNKKIDEDVIDHTERLQEIAATAFGTLPDDEVLRLLAERKRLEELQREYERLRKEDEARLLEQKKAEKLRETEKKKEALTEAIKKLNLSITPDKTDEDLLALVSERKELERELENVGADEPHAPSAATKGEPAIAADIDAPGGGTGKKKQQADEEAAALSPGAAPAESPSDSDASFRQEFGSAEIVGDDFKEGGELHRYLNQLKNNTGSLGTLLQEMPIAAKRNKKFMLKVAEIDSAYAMHYAADTLKNDEDFNIRIATMKNTRNSGNAVAEMLPEARTSKVVLAAVKQDYRNIKFVQPNMEEYDEMMRIAKKAALEKVKDLKDAADIMLLIPRPLQQDKQFMAEIKKIADGESK